MLVLMFWDTYILTISYAKPLPKGRIFTGFGEEGVRDADSDHHSAQAEHYHRLRSHFGNGQWQAFGVGSAHDLAGQSRQPPSENGGAHGRLGGRGERALLV